MKSSVTIKSVIKMINMVLMKKEIQDIQIINIKDL